MKLEKGDWVYNTYTKKPEQIQDIIGKQYMLDYNDLYDEEELEPLTNEHISTYLSRYKEHQKEDDFDISRYTLHNKLLECCKIKDDYYKNLFIKYTQWLDKRGFFHDDLCFDIEHQVDTFLNLSDDKFKIPKLVKLNQVLTQEQQKKAMEFIADKANKRGPFESEDLFEYILKIGIERDYAFYLISCCLGFEYIKNLLKD